MSAIIVIANKKGRHFWRPQYPDQPKGLTN